MRIDRITMLGWQLMEAENYEDWKLVKKLKTEIEEAERMAEAFYDDPMTKWLGCDR